MPAPLAQLFTHDPCAREFTHDPCACVFLKAVAFADSTALDSFSSSALTWARNFIPQEHGEKDLALGPEAWGTLVLSLWSSFGDLHWLD